MGIYNPVGGFTLIMAILCSKTAEFGVSPVCHLSRILCLADHTDPVFHPFRA
jgi:hypothetical protein